MGKPAQAQSLTLSMASHRLSLSRLNMSMTALAFPSQIQAASCIKRNVASQPLYVPLFESCEGLQASSNCCEQAIDWHLGNCSSRHLHGAEVMRLQAFHAIPSQQGVLRVGAVVHLCLRQSRTWNFAGGKIALLHNQQALQSFAVSYSLWSTMCMSYTKFRPWKTGAVLTVSGQGISSLASMSYKTPIGICLH